ncbi:tRNA lysidine(34) synthetase TilS [Gordonia sp. OPL2]|uniref:tRNA lysidine(34) synthetase TilS n=1 Tax=Gordonia sp. OPL2 TaxID=2486274 RepID=UPI0016564CDA|nr:tRNA lysidine(34) synthetase TilS [Gordonia sp. OPL2]ROZ88746.1 tRNA lysidine(34) synthetase TilS [Gordonia sp. OPL2]
MDAAGAVTQAVTRFVAGVPATADGVCVGLSGGPDSLALLAATVRAGLDVRALVVDHGLQETSRSVAAEAAVAARGLGADAEVLTVVVDGVGGLEAAARDARYRALDDARTGRPVLLAHTADDQAETVLLGLARGSGARSLAGMREWNAPWGRPLLGIRRSQTMAACADLGLRPHHDPHNRDPRFTRVRVRAEVLPLLDDVLHGGVVEALGRTAAALRADNDALDDYAADAYDLFADGTGLETPTLSGMPAAVRTRVVRRWLIAIGATEPTHRVISAVDDLVTDRTRGQVAIGGDPSARRVVERCGERLTVRLVER